jgi:protein-tyrosine phosphatase
MRSALTAHSKLEAAEMTNFIRRLIPFLATFTLLAGPAFAEIDTAAVERRGPDAVVITWAGHGPVDILEAKDRRFDLSSAKVVATQLTTGDLPVANVGAIRRYYILRDEVDHTLRHVAERVLPLEQGSNFRDVGGYRTKDGRHTRWGLIYRSGAQPMLTSSDLDQIRALGLAELVDLRSSEERVIAPSKIMGVPTTAVGYTMADLITTAAPRNGVDLYRKFPVFLAPELKVVFASLLRGDTPMAYNCSAGQDRTGFTTAMILSALGVPRDVIVSDYLLSMQYRHPEFEMPALNPAEHPNDPVVRMFAAYRARPNWKTPDRLIDDQGRPFLTGAFAEIEEKWGSIDNYLAQEIGLTPLDIARLKAVYLEP